MNIQFCTGSGQSDTHIYSCQPYQTKTMDDLLEMVREPASVDKDKAQSPIFSNYHQFDARNHKAQKEYGSFVLLPVDLDEGAPQLDDVKRAVTEALGDVWHVIYSSRSATREKPKWRILFQPSCSVPGADYTAIQRALFDLLGQRGLVCDKALERPGQLVYLPNKGGHYEWDIHKGPTLSTDTGPLGERVSYNARMLEDYRKAGQEAAERPPRRPLGKDTDDDPMQWCNANFTLSDLLRDYGYEQEGNSGNWRSPHQTSGSYATKVYPDNRWVSLSGSDFNSGIGEQSAESGSCFGDAYDLYVHYQHKGDHKKAYQALRAMMPKTDSFADFDFHTPAIQDDNIEEPNLVLNKHGKPEWSPQNAFEILRTHEAWDGVLAYNEFTGLYMLLKPIPQTRTPKSSFTPRPIVASDYFHARRWFNLNGFPRAPKNDCTDALLAACHESVLSPVSHYLEDLKWDGKPRLLSWLAKYCGAEDNDFNRKVGKLWMISAVARALKPGCKADCCLVLEGKQGAGKSTAFKVLAGDDWFHDGLADLHNKDASAGLLGKWIIELPELSAMKRSETEAVKAFLSRTTERYRPAYNPTEVVQPRRCVFAGTTNRQDYLSDDTGGRRFWPVAIKSVDIDCLKMDRDQLWAEAVQEFNAGTTWWLNADDAEMATEVVMQRTAEDPWESQVLSFVRNRHEVSSKDIFEHLAIPLEQRSQVFSKRVLGIITRAGWTRAGKFWKGDNRGSARYVPPGALGV